MAAVEKEHKVMAHDEAPAIISNHPFVPRGQWWSLCKVCGLAQAAHAETTIDSVAEMKADQERQRAWREADRRRKHASGREQIGHYVSDEDDD